jgi:hypothetical protein
MCCFSRSVISVSATQIFARPADKERQFLVYSMAFEAKTELAMILPLPVRLPAGEEDVKFIDLKSCPDFFSDLAKGFPRHRTWSLGENSQHTKGMTAASLAVVSVGDFEASFVPTIDDFSRLDVRFRIDDKVWKKIPGYESYSFAVFKLKPGAMTVQPMAFSFPRRYTQKVFFPTVHIHDGEVHKEADFDHTIYCQPGPDEQLSIHDWEESANHPANFMQAGKTKGIILPDQHCYKREMHGSLPNRDTFLAVEA